MYSAILTVGLEVHTCQYYDYTINWKEQEKHKTSSSDYMEVTITGFKKLLLESQAVWK